jgi:DNA-directed RNA polymerase specialized sigma24 family protein
MPMDELDLHAKTMDVRRLTRSHPSFRAAVERGHDAEELLQEVWLVVLTRQAGPTPYDPTRAKFSKWLYQVIRSAVSHYIERISTRRRHEQVGVQGSEEVEDAASWASEHASLDLAEDERAAIVATLQEMRIEPRNEIIRYLLAGHSIVQARKYFGPHWHTELDRLAGKVREALMRRMQHSECLEDERDKS